MNIRSAFFFLAHLFVTLMAWFAPFLISWYFAIAAYTAVMLQFQIFGKCLVNEHHGLAETDGRIFYTDLLEAIGLRLDRKKVKFVVRVLLYPTLAVVTLIWQLLLHHTPLWF